jgi:hypothetical protein
MKKILLYVLAASCHAAPAAAQFTITAPTSATPISVRAADDFATRAFQDPWDMSQRTDVGWWTFGTDTSIAVNFSNPAVAGGVFSGTNPNAAAGLYLLESPLAPTPGGSAAPVGKTGQQYPIDAGYFTHLVYRMSSTQGGVSQYVWSETDIYADQTLAVEQTQSATVVHPGWKIYDVPLTSLSVLLASKPWSGTRRALQILPLAGANSATIQLDWVRLVHDEAALHQNITWTGGAADVYIDSDANPANGTLGRIAVNRASPFNFFVGALPAGRYFIALHATTAGEATTGFTYSTGSYQVNEIPTLQFTTPSEEGSSEDFATTKLGDPWDFTTITDVDSTLPGYSGTEHVTGAGIGVLSLRNEAGVDLGPQTVYFGTSTPATADTGNVGDPQIYTLFWDGKGKVAQIDPRRYRILTVEAGIPNMARSLLNGSIGRVVWRAVNEPMIDALGIKVRTVGEHWALNSAAGENTVARMSIDMNTMPIEPGSPDPNTTWSSSIAAGGLDALRFDPHEFSSPTQFFIKRIKLAALERSVSSQLTFRWNYSKAAGTVQLFRQATTSPKNFTGGTLISGGSVSATAGSFTWNTTGTPDGEYQIYAIFTDGTNTNQVYAPTNVVVDSASVATKQINLNRTQLNFSIFGPVRTQAQQVRLTFTGSGSECWTTTSNAGSLISVSPASGNGAATLSIVPAPTANFPGGTTSALITVASCTNPANTRAIAVNVTGLNTTTAPAGAMDTPADGAVVTGSIAVTGWAADDLEVVRVAVCRDPVPATETTTPTLCAGQSKVFIGDAVFIDDARPDVQAANPGSPFNYRAGWGYLLLSNFLPSQGNAVVTLYAYAIDREGNAAQIGVKTINAQNAAATKPFGAIDSPAQGEVVCGTIINFGWALTQNGKDVPANSSTIGVYVDGVLVGQPGPRAARVDITNAFPGLDTSHAVGGFFLDTTLFSNGLHSIFWIVTDSAGQADGIGSRFFTISNPCSGG